MSEHVSGSAFGRVLDLQALEPALAHLTAEQRQAVQLRFLDGLSVADTALMMGRSDEAVKKLQARSLTNVRRLLAPAAPARVSAGPQQLRQAVA